MNKTHDGDCYTPPTPPPTLAHAWASLLAAAWGIAWRRPGAQRELAAAVEGLGSAWADRLQLDATGRTPEEARAEEAELAALEALDVEGEGDPAEEGDSAA